MSDNKNKPLHIAMYPWFGLSHITSNLHLANKLAKRGLKVSLLLPPNAQAKLASHNYHPSLISIIPIPVPHVDGLPPGAETTNDIPMSAIPHLVTAMDLTRDTIKSHLISLKPDFVLFDFTYWLPEIARELGIKSMYYHTSYLLGLAYSIPKVRDKHYTETKGSFFAPPQDFPNQSIRLKGHEARTLEFGSTIVFGGLPILERFKRGLEECDAIGSKTCREMEGHYCDYLEKYFGKPVILAGPVLPESLASTLDHHIDGWLKGFDDNDVVYCALGSQTTLNKEHFQEIVLGLELTDRPFLAALKPPLGYETVESALPEGFLQRTAKKGIVDGGWVQQQLILKHPSVGCFITHCGAGSLSEAMLNSCQLVMMPQSADQFINAKLMSLELKVAIEVETREEDGFVTKEAICEAVSKVMDAESEVRKNMRTNHAKLRDFLLGEGVEEAYISSFIQKLRDFIV